MRIIDTGDKILTGDNHPQLKIGNKLYLVDDRKSTYDKIQEVQADEALTDNEKNIEILELALGEEETKELVNDGEIAFSSYVNLTFYVLAAITGEDFETLKARANSKN